jgi:hypothetical protein
MCQRPRSRPTLVFLSKHLHEAERGCSSMLRHEAAAACSLNTSSNCYRLSLMLEHGQPLGCEQILLQEQQVLKISHAQVAAVNLPLFKSEQPRRPSAKPILYCAVPPLPHFASVEDLTRRAFRNTIFINIAMLPHSHRQQTVLVTSVRRLLHHRFVPSLTCPSPRNQRLSNYNHLPQSWFAYAFQT